MWDSTLLAYVDRSRVIPPAHRRLVTRQNGDVLPALLVDGVCGRGLAPVEGGIEAMSFHELAEQLVGVVVLPALTVRGRPPSSAPVVPQKTPSASAQDPCPSPLPFLAEA
jgi:hypothetical protein